MQRVGLYVYLFPTFAQGRKVLWDGIDGNGYKFLDHIPHPLRKRVNDQEMRIELVNGSIFQIIGTDNYNSLRGTNPIGCIFSEFSFQDPAAWDITRPILNENGGFAIFNYTPNGSNHGKDLYNSAVNDPSWFCQILTINDTARENGQPIITSEQVQAEIAQGMDPDLAEQEFYCSFNGAKQGAYYGPQMKEIEEQSRIINSLYDPSLPVKTYWDLGIDDSTSIVFIQQIQREIRIIDYFEKSGEGLSFFVKALSEKPYVYDGHYLPHDIEVRDLTIGKTRKEFLQSLGLRPIHTVPAPKTKEEGIHAVRSVLPKVWIDKTKSARLVDCLKNYSKEWDEKGKVWRSRPRHDWASHGNDAFQTFALSYRDIPQIKEYAYEVPFDRFAPL